MEVKIEKSVPMPEARTSQYPFGQMEVGDSFALQAEDPEGLGKLQRTVNAAKAAYRQRLAKAGKNPGKFTVRKQDGRTIRVWKIAA